MTMVDLQDRFFDALVVVRVAKLLKDHGREDAFQLIRDCYCADYDDEYPASIEALENISDFFRHDYDDESDMERMYFSDRAIMEYYRLCREDARLRKIPFEESPLVKKAEDYVQEWMNEPGCYYCGYGIKLDPEEQWGCGIIFDYSAYDFYEYYPLLQRMLHVLDFYRDELPTLRREVDALKRPFAIVPYLPKGGAA